ncbi:hypothetical protein BCR34DRAFT_637033 [Clohesyomyces aquaticus]|uniref:Uncharacterized protein n=1 Tax=Clohesyomyces aquaticus TaxID=1231657 RepID=A0A1Y2A277_9PLEO|nr:hypothetical protein BCR34DRAFT_637033 [Clohesyomyces aquaticus]
MSSIADLAAKRGIPVARVQKYLCPFLKPDQELQALKSVFHKTIATSKRKVEIAERTFEEHDPRRHSKVAEYQFHQQLLSILELFGEDMKVQAGRIIDAMEQVKDWNSTSDDMLSFFEEAYKKELNEYKHRTLVYGKQITDLVVKFDPAEGLEAKSYVADIIDALNKSHGSRIGPENPRLYVTSAAMLLPSLLTPSSMHSSRRASLGSRTLDAFLLFSDVGPRRRIFCSVISTPYPHLHLHPTHTAITAIFSIPPAILIKPMLREDTTHTRISGRRLTKMPVQSKIDQYFAYQNLKESHPLDLALQDPAAKQCLSVLAEWQQRTEFHRSQFEAYAEITSRGHKEMQQAGLNTEAKVAEQRKEAVAKQLMLIKKRLYWLKNNTKTFLQALNALAVELAKDKPQRSCQALHPIFELLVSLQEAVELLQFAAVSRMVTDLQDDVPEVAYVLASPIMMRDPDLDVRFQEYSKRLGAGWADDILARALN